MMNAVMIEGRVTKDFEIQKTKEKSFPYTNFSIANDRGFGESKKASFFDVMVWGETAERMEKAKVKKGSHIYLRGILSQSVYEKDGVKHSRTKIVINDSGEWGYISSGQKPDNGNKANTEGNAKKTSGNQGNSSAVAEGPPDGFMTVEDDQLPF